MLRKPVSPPPFRELLEQVGSSSRQLEKVLMAATRPERTARYYHWEKLLHLEPPEGLNHAEWWLALKLKRGALGKTIPLLDTANTPFVYVLADPIPERLQQIDQACGGRIEMPTDALANPETKDRYLISSLIDEAITSSQLEGAATTRQVARDMIRNDRKPRDRGEQMILNNYHTMKYISELRDKRVSKELICELHRMVTRNTLNDSSMSGRFRLDNQKIDVADDFGQVFHTPPPAEELDGRVSALCDFANGETPKEFVHPVIRSIILHFWLAYDHPFVDGNGRTARALFYWSMLRYGYWLCEFISISEIIRKGPSKYGRAFLHTETDGNDMTYFLIYHLDVIRRAIDQLNSYVERKTSELRRLERELRGMQFLNHRQQALVSHALRHPHGSYSIASHQTSHGVVYQTARSDLLDLAQRGLLESRKKGRTWHFRPAPNLEHRLAHLPG